MNQAEMEDNAVRNDRNEADVIDWSEGPEWASRTQHGYTETYCPICEQDRHDGHADWCPWRGKVAVSVDGLREIEWAFTRVHEPHADVTEGLCPVCEHESHTSDCWLGNALSRFAQDAE